MKFSCAVSMVLLAGQSQGEEVDPQLKLQRILSKFSAITDKTVGRVRTDYSRLDIKKERVHRMGAMMLKNFGKINSRCVLYDFEDDEQDARTDDACFAFKKICKRILNWSKAFNPDCQEFIGMHERTEDKLTRITKPILRILQCDPDLNKNPKN